MLNPVDSKPRLYFKRVALNNLRIHRLMCFKAHILRGVGSYLDNGVRVFCDAMLSSCDMFGEDI